jgi:hypothetical protein
MLRLLILGIVRIGGQKNVASRISRSPHMCLSAWSRCCLIAVCLACLGIWTAAPVCAQEGAKKDATGVIILELVTQEQGKAKGKSKPEKEEDKGKDDEKEMDDEEDEEMEDEDEGDDDDDKVKNKKAQRSDDADDEEMDEEEDEDESDDDDKVEKKKRKKAKQKKEDKKPKAKREVKPREQQEPGEMRRDPRSFEFRWDGPPPWPRPEQRMGDQRQMRGEMPRGEGDRPRGESRPDDARKQEEMRRDIERQRQQIEAEARQMRRQLEQTRLELEERARRDAGNADERQQMMRHNQALGQRFEAVQRELQERTAEVEKLRSALEQREKAIVELKQMLAKQAAGGKGGAKPVDASLEARIERIEVEIKKLMGALKQTEARGSWKQTEPKKEALPFKEMPKRNVELKLNVGPAVTDQKPRGALVLGNARLKLEATEPAKPLPATGTLKLEFESKPALPKVELPRVILDVKPQVVPPPPRPAEEIVPAQPAALGGVGVVEGDVTAVLGQEGKIVLKVCSWNDGKQMRADWVGQQVAIVKGEMPAVKVGDHVSLDARIESGKGFVWGRKVFNVTAAR